MKNIINLGCFLGLLFFGGNPALAMPSGDLKDPAKTSARSRVPLEMVELFLVLQETGAVKEYREKLMALGKAESANRVRYLEELYTGNNAGAFQVLDLIKKKDAWIDAREKYLTGQMEIHRSFTETKSDHFIVRRPAEDTFLARYALPSLESVYGRVAEFFGSSPTFPSVIQIYPTVDAFTFAATLAKEDVEQTGSVVTSRYGRIMILSPGATPFGYRWLDGLVHDYVHQQLNRVSAGNGPSWLQEGAARYATRYGWTVEGKTLELIHKAVAEAALKRFSTPTDLRKSVHRFFSSND